mmetsp:Transcript_13750/g.24540  ORF Transcript_13750/g.24540 Transcript_13750/m.24540 type:complete len:87 (-) Transcript_13750:88-348(-)
MVVYWVWGRLPLTRLTVFARQTRQDQTTPHHTTPKQTKPHYTTPNQSGQLVLGHFIKEGEARKQQNKANRTTPPTTPNHTKPTLAG